MKNPEYKPGVSILVRAHLEAPFLFEALESVGNQTTSIPLEVLINLDRPSPGLRAQIECFRIKYPQIKLHDFEFKSVGPAGALNLLANESEYEFLAILDSDDRMQPSRIEKQHTFLAENPEICVIGSALNVIDELGVQIGQQGFLIDPDKVRSLKWRKLPVAHPSVLMRKSVFLAIGGYREFYFPSEDYDLWLRILESHRIANLSETLTDYRLHSLQATSSKLFRNISSGISARESEKLRKKGKAEIHQKHKSSTKWAVTSPYFPIILRNFLRSSIWYKIPKTNGVIRLLLAITLMLISPISGTTELWKKIRQKLK
jgi:glycosyltransferase involved in cell wall biosynthesis